MKKLCENCGEKHELVELVEHEEHQYCTDCFRKLYQFCDVCEEFKNADEVAHTYLTNSMMCDDCRDDLVILCDECGEEILEEDAFEVDYENGLYCQDCVTSCDECGHDTLASDLVYVESNDRCVCDDCMYTYYFTCDDCGEVIHTDDQYSDYNDGTYCQECGEKHNLVLRYHSGHPDGITFFDSKESLPLYMGIENEVDDFDDMYSRNESAEYAINTIGYEHIHLEEDGSLGDGCSFEMITQPMTLKYHMELKNKYKNAFEDIIHNGGRSHDTCTCGLHVHVDRKYLRGKDSLRINEEYNIIKILYLLEKFDSEFATFARRDNDNYARKIGIRTIKDAENHFYNDYKERYNVLNLTNSDTIEFRLFRGTLNVNTFIATLQMVQCIVDTAIKHNSESIQALHFVDIIDEKYPELIEYCIIRNLIEEKTEEQAG